MPIPEVKEGQDTAAQPLSFGMRLLCIQLEASCLQWIFLLTLEMKKTWAIAKRRFLINTFRAQIQSSILYIFQRKHPEFRRMAESREKSSECYGPSFSSSNYS